MRFLFLLAAWVRRDFRVRYSQTLFGSLWMLVQPLALTAAFTFLFDGVTTLDVGVPYVVFAYTGMLLWSLVANGLTMAASSVYATMYIASKAKYPRVVAPLSASALSLTDLSAGILGLPVVLLWSRAEVSPQPWVALAALVGSVVLVAGVGTLLSALAIFIRDIRNALPFILQIGLLLTPVAYQNDHVPKAFETATRWNPLAVFVEGWRSGILGTAGPSPTEWARAALISTVLAAVGFWYFHAVEDRFPDVA